MQARPRIDHRGRVRRRSRWAALPLVAALGIAACGGDDDDDGADTDATESEATDAAEESTADTSEDTAGEEATDDTDDTADDGGDGAATENTETAASDAPAAPEEEAVEIETDLPDGVMRIDVATELGIDGDIDWGERCDTERGTYAVPNFFAPPCYQPFDGDNGGETAPGVTGDSIKVVYWLTQDDDAIMNYLTSAIANDDTAADNEDTIRGLAEYYQTYYETYGRTVDREIVVGSGNSSDEAAARADAVKIAEDIDPFIVLGGPTLTSAFAEELAARGIPCISCGPTAREGFHEEYPMMNYSIGKSQDQLNLIVAEYIGKRLAGDPAIHAGDEAMHDQERVFGRIWIESSPASADQNEKFEATLADEGVEISESQSYVLDPGTLQESAASVIARMKEAGVTSVIINGDPIAPREFTNEASAQNYFPEWIVTGSALIDTTAFARTYNQDQWANAFGISNLNARVDRTKASAYAIYEWFHGAPPAANETIGVLDPSLQTLFNVLQGAGPDLTVESFNAAFFDAPPTVRAITNPTLDWGDTDRWPAEYSPDYYGVDDISEIWWDTSRTGLDEIDKEGQGMWAWVDGGVRYLYGEIPEGAPKAFVQEGSVAVYDDRPPQESVPTGYTPLAAG